MEGTVSISKRILLWDKLIILKFSSSISNTLLSYELMHSLTSDVIGNIVAKSFSPHDIFATMPIFVIYIFREDIHYFEFGDIEMYDFEESNDYDL